MASVYILESKSTGRIYTGSAHEDTPDSQIKAHNSGKAKFTKNGIPWTLIFQEKYKTYIEARNRELFLKTSAGRKWIKEKCQK